MSDVKKKDLVIEADWPMVGMITACAVLWKVVKYVVNGVK